MIIYIDLIFLLNIYLDFLIILVTSLILKRNISIKRILVGSFVGGISTFLLFMELSSSLLFLFKFLFSILMIISSFSYKSFKYFINNLFYLYITSMVLGGGLYIFEFDNIFLLLIFSFIILYFYIKELSKLKNNYNNYYKVEFLYKNNKYNFIGYIDSGNKLKDQYRNRPINLVYSDDINYDYEDVILVPYETASGYGILKCIKLDKIIINSREYSNSLIGFMDKKINIDGVGMILNSKFIDI
ncbi:MAG: sigma-E processing peptidase SpoIIGA [Bacilli bacterium]|nr:sigma-E processing peptidase SpoIIGA [Bacilli bacterium]